MLAKGYDFATPTLEKLRNKEYKRRELQTFARSLGIKANGKNEELTGLLTEWVVRNTVSQKAELTRSARLKEQQATDDVQLSINTKSRAFGSPIPPSEIVLTTPAVGGLMKKELVTGVIDLAKSRATKALASSMNSKMSAISSLSAPELKSTNNSATDPSVFSMDSSRDDKASGKLLPGVSCSFTIAPVPQLPVSQDQTVYAPPPDVPLRAPAKMVFTQVISTSSLNSSLKNDLSRMTIADALTYIPDAVRATPTPRELREKQYKELQESVVKHCTNLKKAIRRSYDERVRQFNRLSDAECIEIPQRIRDCKICDLGTLITAGMKKTALNNLSQASSTLRGMKTLLADQE